MNRRHPSPSFSLAAVALLCALAFPARAANPADFIALAPAQAKALGVETRPLAAADTGSAAGLPAKVVVPVEQMRVVAAPLAGLLTQVGAVAGQTVKKGQMLARLASPGLLQVQRDYLQARQQADLAQRSLARDEQLFKEGIIAEARLQASRASQAQAAVAARELQAELRIAGATAGGGSLTPEVAVSAPLDGVVLEASAAVGSRVEAATALFTVAQLNPLWLEIQAPAALAGNLKEGAAVRIAGSEASGKLINVGRQISPGSQTVTLRARMDAGLDSLHPGQMVEATVAAAPQAGATAGKSAAYRIPQAAVVRQAGQAWVFVQTAGARPGFQATPVTVAGNAGADVLVSGSALAANAAVAVKGVSALKSAWSTAASAASDAGSAQ
ncbi:RND family efflux transporter, MFP subunit [Azospira oryzae PS]|uniref:RND family efflux transporter, MFP subunit n=1 Tax=Azospira oryzae (strain ATCC BAA-33 / DSM 13638 / PS) TaxID=640081 RepID=G8QKL9_AZOOP|nr:efflux RND transporter periplasmic adaptor subunit [Azospira oryzae]AEV27758.1 RND family efflux transporter, MFP subunit [Azospira oryzae PS]